MKKLLTMILAACLALFPAGCEAEPSGPSMYIEVAELTAAEKAIAELLGLDTEHSIFDFVLDDSLQSIQINTYELAGGEWKLISGGGGQAVSAASGRIALGFDIIGEGLRTAIQCGGAGGSTSYEADPTVDFTGMGCATSQLSGRTEAVYEQEIPLAVQIVTAKDEIHSYDFEYFHSPEEYAKHDYEHVYAITVRFSQKKVSEL